MSVVSVNDPRLASRVGTRTWGARLSGSPIITALTRIIREYAASRGWRREVAVKMLVAL
jgi:hypothetical protein